MDYDVSIEKILNNIRQNCIEMNKYHKKRYFELSYSIKYYRLPVIIFNGINSIIAVGLQKYISQEILSLLTSLIALTCSIIGSIELYLRIQKRLENDLISQRDYYILSIDIYKTLNISVANRPANRPVMKEYLDKTYNSYIKLIENSDVLNNKINDLLIPITMNINENGIVVLEQSTAE
jgi:hypothetical protein